MSDANGPLILPLSPDPALTVKLAELGAHALSARWLPDGLWPELDEVRDEHLRVRARVAADLERLNALESKFQNEDRRVALALTQGHRTGETPPLNELTPEERRVAERKQIAASMWTGVQVLVEVVDRARRVMAEHQKAWHADLIRNQAEYAEAVRDAERLKHEAQLNAWRSVQLARWLKGEVMGGVFGHQPAPTGQEPMPPQFDPTDHADAYEIRYFERERVRPIPQSPPSDDPLALEDDDGEVLIEPLDDATRFGAAR